MFKPPLSPQAIQAAVGSHRDCDIADARAIGLDFAVWVFVSDAAGECYKPSSDKLIRCSSTYARAEHMNAAPGYLMHA